MKNDFSDFQPEKNMEKTGLLFLLFATILTTQAQTANPAADKEVQAVIQQLFDGMRKSDSTLLRPLFYANARLQTTFTDKNGKPVLKEDSIGKFIEQIGTPHAETYDERILGYEIRTDDNLATVWTPYEFYLGGKFSHRGVNAFQLFRSEGGWQIIQITDTRRKK